MDLKTRSIFFAFFVAVAAVLCCSISAATIGGGNDNSACRSHGDCADDLACFADLKCRDPCTHSLHGLQCGPNAGCKAIHHRPECVCQPGFNGDPLRGCGNNLRELQEACENSHGQWINNTCAGFYVPQRLPTRRPEFTSLCPPGVNCRINPPRRRNNRN